MKYPQWLVVTVLTLLAYGCPLPAIVAAFALDERTVSTWQDKAGQHAKRVQEAIVCQGQVDVGQVQGDEFMSKPSPVASGWRRRCASFRGCCSGVRYRSNAMARW
ncbi:MAG: hypothetical protein R3E79_16050 [Caldilineaceae bacterium]